MTITPDQISFYRTFGYLPLRQAFSPAEAAEIQREFDALLVKDREGQPFPGTKRQTLYGFAERSEILTRLIVDDRIYGTVEQLLGSDFLWLCSEGNLYVGDTQWHPDGSRLPFPPMKVSFYLDPLTAENGCLRVIPGSHLPPFHEELKQVASGSRDPGLPSVPLETRPGDVFFLNMNLWHASFGGAPGRRHMALNFVTGGAGPEYDALLRENHAIVLRIQRDLQYSQPARNFEDDFLRSEHPRIRRLVAKWNEFGLT